jgi:D-alanyl-D-alanine dipeptidase
MLTSKGLAARQNFARRTVFTPGQLTKIRPGASAEPLVDARKYDSKILTAPNREEMRKYTGDSILVRDTVAQMLAAVNARLQKELGLVLKVAYGYRHPDVQAAYFDEAMDKLRETMPDASEEERIGSAHLRVAYPPVAGHPTGGAVDVQIATQDGADIDMGQGDADWWGDHIQTFADGLTGQQTSNRVNLANVMFAAGFVPFWGEWWHFSYGDREWAAFTGRKAALYDAVSLSANEGANE